MGGWPLPDVLSQIVYKYIHTSYTSSLNKDYFYSVISGNPLNELAFTLAIDSTLVMDRTYVYVYISNRYFNWIATFRNDSVYTIRNFRRNKEGVLCRNPNRDAVLPKNY